MAATPQLMKFQKPNKVGKDVKEKPDKCKRAAHVYGEIQGMPGWVKCYHCPSVKRK